MTSGHQTSERTGSGAEVSLRNFTSPQFRAGVAGTGVSVRLRLHLGVFLVSLQGGCCCLSLASRLREDLHFSLRRHGCSRLTHQASLSPGASLHGDL